MFRLELQICPYRVRAWPAQRGWNLLWDGERGSNATGYLTLSKQHPLAVVTSHVGGKWQLEDIRPVRKWVTVDDA